MTGIPGAGCLSAKRYFKK